jgi:hypothetical protein
MKRGRHWHKATKREKEMIIALSGGPEKHHPGPRGVNEVAIFDPSPVVSPATLRRWKHEKRVTGELHEPLPAGHPNPILSSGEKRVLGGKVLEDWAEHMLVSVETLRSSVLGFWDQPTSHGYIVDLMRNLNLPSKAVNERDLKYFNPNLVPESIEFLIEINQLLINGLSTSKLVATDVCYWTSSRHILRSYGPGGRYFPSPIVSTSVIGILESPFGE